MFLKFKVNLNKINNFLYSLTKIERVSSLVGKAECIQHTCNHKIKNYGRKYLSLANNDYRKHLKAFIDHNNTNDEMMRRSRGWEANF
jgi:hypothetical protein